MYMTSVILLQNDSSDDSSPPTIRCYPERRGFLQCSSIGESSYLLQRIVIAALCVSLNRQRCLYGAGKGVEDASVVMAYFSVCTQLNSRVLTMGLSRIRCQTLDNTLSIRRQQQHLDILKFDQLWSWTHRPKQPMAQCHHH